MFQIDSTIYIYGGIGPSGYFNDLWAYDIETDQWTEQLQQNLIPPRFDFAYTSFQMDSISYFAVVGGIGYNDTLGDFYV